MLLFGNHRDEERLAQFIDYSQLAVSLKFPSVLLYTAISAECPATCPARAVHTLVH